MQKILWAILPILLIGILLFLLLDQEPPAPPPAGPDDAIPVFVSIPPLKQVVEQIGGARVTVTTFLRPGDDPHSFEPRPEQMAQLSRARLFFLTGDPSELAWIEKTRDSYPLLSFIQTDAGIRKRAPDRAPDHEKTEHAAHHPEGFAAADHAECPHYAEHHGGDPHIWLSPELLVSQARIVATALSAIDGGHAALYEENFARFVTRMEGLDQRLRTMLAPFKGRRFFVFHPSWGYFADRYGLVQVPLEATGREAGAAHLARVNEQLAREKRAVVFVPPRMPEEAARAIGAGDTVRLVTLDPLAETVEENLLAVAAAIGASFGDRP